MPRPLVSVLVPTYEYARYLPSAIGSILSQSLRDWELIVVDDASRDGTADLLEDYGKRDRRIRWEINPRNIGAVANWNRCLSMARGEYVKFLLADDLLPGNDALSRMAGCLEADSGVSLVASARQVIDADSAERDVWCHWPDGSVHEGKTVIRRCLLDDRNYIGEPSAVLFRRSDAGRGFDTRYLQLADLEMWFHLLEKGRFAYIAEPLCAFRRHPRQQTEASRRDRIDLLDHHRIFQDYVCRPYLALSPFERWYLGFHAARMARRRARKSGAPREIRRKLMEDYGMGRYLLGYPLYRLRRSWLKMTGSGAGPSRIPVRPRT